MGSFKDYSSTSGRASGHGKRYAAYPQLTRRSRTRVRRSQWPVQAIRIQPVLFSRTANLAFPGENNSNDSSTSDSSSDGSDTGGLSTGNRATGPLEKRSIRNAGSLHIIAQDLLPLAWDRIKSWIPLAQYLTPPDKLPSSRHRAQIITWLDNSDIGAIMDGQSVLVSRFHGYFHLACPYYVYNGERYQSCLRDHDLQSIEDVITHLRKHHTEPPYCPLCYQAFQFASSRDDHVLQRTCEIRSSGEVEGINELQKRRLRKLDRPYLGEKERWKRVWSVVFPGSKLSRSPYLENGVEKTTSIIRDYWAICGKDYILKYLAGGLLSIHDIQSWQRLLDVLYASTLEGLLSQAFEDYNKRG